MEINSLKEYLQANPQAFTELIADKEGFDLVRPHFDRYAGQAVKTHSEKHPSSNAAAEALTRRLDRIEKAGQLAKVANDMRFHVFQKAGELGVPFELVQDIPFPGEKEADKKIEDLAAAIKTREIQDMNERMANGWKPGSGNAPGGSAPRDFVAEAEARGRRG
jgi:hypothetical protein